MKKWQTLLLCVIAAAIGALFMRPPVKPCPAHHFTIIGDSNVARWDVGVGCANLGVAGDTSQQMAMRFAAKDLIPLGGPLVIWGTANDVHFRAQYGIFYIRKMALEARAAGLHVILTTPIPLIDESLLPPSGRLSQHEIDAEIGQLREQILAFGLSQHFAVADVHEALVRADGSLNKSLYSPGPGATYAHLNPAGYRTMWHSLEPLVGK